MVNLIRRLSVLAVAAVLVAAAPAAARAPRVLATIPPVHSLAAMVMGGASALGLLIKGGADPHGYALRPSDARLIGAAEVIFWIGPELEGALANALASLARKAHVVTLSAASGVRRIEGRENRRDRRTVRADPHIWLDPANAAAMVRVMAQTLSQIDGANAAAYVANGKKAIAHLTALDVELRDRLTPVRRVPYVVFHDAYRYFEQRYGLNSIAAVTTGAQSAPGARRLQAIQRAMIEHRVPCLFIEPGGRPALADTLRRGTVARIGVLNALGAGIRPGARAYALLMRSLASSLTACLSQ